MKCNIFLYGKKDKVLGWLELFDQEKIPFRYKGFRFKDFSSINILVGYKNPQNIIYKYSSHKVFIIEPLIKSSSNIQEKNILRISKNISSSLIKNKSNRSKIINDLKILLVKAFEIQNLPYIHIWYYPFLSKTVLLFRQDVDYVDEKGLKNLIEIHTKFGIRGTYFINISGEEEFDEKIGHLKLLKPTTPERKQLLIKLIKQGNEMANHGYWHWVFRDFKNNYQNIKRCSYYLKKMLNIKDVGYASPGAIWNEKLNRAIEKNNLRYSCNGLSNEGFPYYPYCHGLKSKVLEIPFYFLCDSSFEPSIKQRFNKSFTEHQHSWYLNKQKQQCLKDFYFNRINNNLKNNEPLGILGHPHIIGKYALNFYPSILKKIHRSNIQNLTIAEFSGWWKIREKYNFSYELNKNMLTIKSNKPGVYFEIIYKGNLRLIKTNSKCNAAVYL